MIAIKHNKENPHRLVLVQEFTEGILGYWIVDKFSQTHKLKDGDFILIDDLESITYIPLELYNSDNSIKVKINRIIGMNLIETYLSDNISINLTFEQSIQQLQKFQIVKAFLEVGNLEDSKVIIQNTPTDDVFTDERKAKYLAMFP